MTKTSNIPKEDFEELKRIGQTDPEFVKSYFSSYSDFDEVSVEDFEPKPEAKELNNWISIKDCSKILNCSDGTVRNYITSGLLEAKREEAGKKRWLICRKNLDEFLISREKEKKEEPVEEELNSDDSHSQGEVMKDETFDLESQIKYKKANQRTVLDFMQNFEKSNLTRALTVATLVENFNIFSETPTDENKMSKYLSRLSNKGIITRFGKGIYTSIVKETRDEPVSIPKIKSEKDPETKAIEDYIDRMAEEDKNFYFSLEEISHQYPKLRHKEIKNAIDRMIKSKSSNIEKISEGKYCRKGSVQISLEDIHRLPPDLLNKVMSHIK
jgi:hypothetical protein